PSPGQLIGNRPRGSTLPNSTSPTPSPSLPGSHAATTALAQVSTPPRSSGRPDTTTTTVATPDAWSWSSTAASSPVSVGLVPTSPSYSAYGFSPTTAIATSNPWSTSAASGEWTILPVSPISSSIPARIDVPPGIGPVTPCH